MEAVARGTNCNYVKWFYLDNGELSVQGEHLGSRWVSTGGWELLVENGQAGEHASPSSYRSQSFWVWGRRNWLDVFTSLRNRQFHRNKLSTGTRNWLLKGAKGFCVGWGESVWVTEKKVGSVFTTLEKNWGSLESLNTLDSMSWLWCGRTKPETPPVGG